MLSQEIAVLEEMDDILSSQISHSFLHVCANQRQIAPLAILAREVVVVLPSLIVDLLRRKAVENNNFNVAKYMFEMWFRLNVSDVRKSYMHYRMIVSTVLRIFIHDYMFDYFILTARDVIDLESWIKIVIYEAKSHGISATLYSQILKISPNSIFQILQSLSPQDLMLHGIECLASSLYCEMDDHLRRPWFLLKQPTKDCPFLKSFLLAHHAFYSSQSSFQDILYTHGMPPSMIRLHFVPS